MQNSPILLQRETSDPREEAVHSVFDGPEFRHATTLALNVLAQATKRDKVGIAATKRTPVNSLLMARASQMTVQIDQPPELGVTKNTFIGLSVPRLLCREKLNIATLSSSNEARWVGNHVRAIIFANPVVNEAAIDA
jgi:hypothetical protein